MKLLTTSYIPKEILEYLAYANDWSGLTTLELHLTATWTDRPSVPLGTKSGTVAIRPTFLHTYPLTDRPHGTLRARDRFLPQDNTHRRLSLAQDRPDRPRAPTHTAARHFPEHLPAIGRGSCRAAVLDRKYESACG